MHLKGSCHCGAVRFSLDSVHPYPYMRCYCSICRKTAGAGGFAINLSGDYETMTIEGEENLSVYQALVSDPETGASRQSPARRHFCRSCGSALWSWDPTWPDLVHPHASAIDSDLPVPPETTHIMLTSKAAWVAVQTETGDKSFDEYPEESIADWHARLDLES